MLKEINSDPFDQVDARKMLTARLLDMVIGDNDRHPDQWKWARFGKKDQVPWVPIAEDRDKVFVSYRGALLSLARKALPNLVTFDSTYPEPTALFANATDFDRRLLGGLDKSVWDSVAISLQMTLTNSVMDSAVRVMPRQYAASSRVIAGKLKARRDGLRAAADHYYGILSTVADIHATDSADKARWCAPATDSSMSTSSPGTILRGSAAGSTPARRKRFVSTCTAAMTMQSSLAMCAAASPCGSSAATGTILSSISPLSADKEIRRVLTTSGT